MTRVRQQVIDTGTRAPTAVPDGLEVRHLPALVRRPLPIDGPRLSDLLSTPHHVLFYSQFSVRQVAESNLPLDQRHRYWAVGRRTAELLTELLPTITDVGVPPGEDFDHLHKCLQATDDRRPLLAISLQGVTRDLGPLAQAWGVAFTEVPVYESAPGDLSRLKEEFLARPPQWMTFTSARGVDAVVEALGADALAAVKLAAIGPSTAATLKEKGLPVELVAPQPDREALLLEIATRSL